MKPVHSANEIYPALDDLTIELQAAGATRLATVIHHRMHQVAWTTRSELFEELQEVLTGAMASESEPLTGVLRHQVECVLLAIGKALAAAPSR